jgi:2-dehydro-3-deoxyphosphogalactonate aldolase
MIAPANENPTEFAAALAQCPLIAILRRVRPAEVEAIGWALVEAGFRLIEVPLNSPDPLASIARLAAALRGRAMVGAGTVLSPRQVEEVAAAGGTLIVAPNADTAVIRAARGAGLAAVPGFATPSEAFGAIAAGANALKLFPAEAASPPVLKAMRAVLPGEIPILPVGGITAEAMDAWTKAGAAGFGLGSALYSPGDGAETVAARARSFVAQWNTLSRA